MERIKIGTCGFGNYKPKEKDWKKIFASKLQAFSHSFDLLEINQTFYGLPMVKTAQRWREEVAEGFEFTLKAWQALTHPTDSPTWRKRREKLTKEQIENFGFLRPNREVIDAWKETMKRAEALGAEICVLQTPASFGFSEENETNMRHLLESIERDKFKLAWEPRGNWNEYPDQIRKICNDLGLIHIVDVMRREPLSDHPTAYIRLHGLNPREFDYRYDYSEEELQTLVQKLTDMADSHDTVYCLFNNDEMSANALRLIDMVNGR